MAAAAIEFAWTYLFRPTNHRMRDLVRASHDSYGSDYYELPDGETEKELIPDLSPEYVLATGITWEDFCRFLGDYMFVWIGPGLYVCTSDNFSHPGYGLVVMLGSLNRQSRNLYVYAATEPETAAATTVTCDFCVHLLATSRENGASIRGFSAVPPPVSGPSLSRFFQESQGNLREFTLLNLVLNEEQIRALATSEPEAMEVILHNCSLSDDNGCHAAFEECLHRDRGPTQLISCNIDCHVLAAALEGSSRVTRLRLINHGTTTDATKGVMFRSLAENRGLVELGLRNYSTSNENWTIMCESLKEHPTLTSLVLPRSHGHRRNELSDEQKSQKTRLLAEMVRQNTVLHTIHLSERERDEQIYTEDILPYLQTNRYRPRVLGIKKAHIMIRRNLLGLALRTESVRNKSNLIWMFLSGNQDVVVPIE
jgi:hypothetical protein